MPKLKADNRSRLIQAATKTTHRHGFNLTTLADIAKEAKIPLGNVYYYFKTKDELGDAIVEHRGNKAPCQVRLTEFDSDQQADTAHIDDLRCFDCSQAREKSQTDLFRAMRQPLRLDHFQRREAGSARQRMTAEGRNMSERRIA